MNTLNRCISLILCPCVSLTSLPVYASSHVINQSIERAELSDEEMSCLVGGNGSVDAVLADYKLGGTTARAVFSNRFSMQCNYELNLVDTNGNIVETLASGTIEPNTSIVVTGSPPVGGTENQRIQARIYHAGLPGMEAIDSSWAASSIDSDGDGLTDQQETQNGLDPFDPSDASADPDADGIISSDEINIYHTDPLNADSDMDGIADGAEIANGLNPNDASDANLDPDQDFLTNAEEINIYGSNPSITDLGLAPDADGDGLNDRLEVALSLDPADPTVKSVGYDSPDEKHIAHILNRLGFGPTSDELAEIQQVGVEAWISQQLVPIGLDEANPDPAQVIRDSYPTPNPHPERLGAIRPVHSVKQLQSRMAVFWDNHFSTSINKNRVEDELQEEDVFFVNAFSNFGSLLLLSARSPAMLRYLDLMDSRLEGPNENYPREVMELHTLGVTSDSGVYGPTEVAELSRILTGWGRTTSAELSRYEVWRNGAPEQRPLYEFLFRSSWHDGGTKSFFGQTFPAAGETGEDEGIRALTMLAQDGLTADFICSKLARHFVSDTPSQATLDNCDMTFQAAQNDSNQIAQVLTTLFASAEFNDPANYRSKFKDNQEYLYSLARFVGYDAIGNTPDGSYLRTTAVGERIDSMGQAMFGKAEPTGWKEDAHAWINANSVVNRFRQANSIIYDSQTHLVDYFTGLGLTSSTDIMGHVFLMMLGGVYEPRHVELAYWALHPDNETFSLDAPDAETRLRNLVARVAQMPEFNLH